MTIYLVDNSALQRVHRSPAVAAALGELLASGDLGSCLPQALEEGYSARNLDEHLAIAAGNQRAKVFLPPIPQVAEIALALQRLLFETGRGRAVGVSDLQIAATALAHSDVQQRVIVVHYDADFGHIADVEPSFRHRWIVPQGSVA